MLTAEYTVINHRAGTTVTVVSYTSDTPFGAEASTKTVDWSATPEAAKPDWTNTDLRKAIQDVAQVDAVVVAEPAPEVVNG